MVIASQNPFDDSPGQTAADAGSLAEISAQARVDALATASRTTFSGGAQLVLTAGQVITWLSCSLIVLRTIAVLWFLWFGQDTGFADGTKAPLLFLAPGKPSERLLLGLCVFLEGFCSAIVLAALAITFGR